MDTHTHTHIDIICIDIHRHIYTIDVDINRYVEKGFPSRRGAASVHYLAESQCGGHGEVAQNVGIQTNNPAICSHELWIFA